MSLNKLPDGSPSPRYRCTAFGMCPDGVKREKEAVLTEWWSDGKKVEDIEESAENYFYEECGFDKNPFKVTSIELIED